MAIDVGCMPWRGPRFGCMLLTYYCLWLFLLHFNFLLCIRHSFLWILHSGWLQTFSSGTFGYPSRVGILTKHTRLSRKIWYALNQLSSSLWFTCGTVDLMSRLFFFFFFFCSWSQGKTGMNGTDNDKTAVNLDRHFSVVFWSFNLVLFSFFF